MATVNEKMKAIADAIRAHTGGTDALTLDAMAEAIAGIQAGGGVTFETGSVTFAENQIAYDFVDYAPDLFICFVSANGAVVHSSAMYVWAMIQNKHTKETFIFGRNNGTAKYYTPYYIANMIDAYLGRFASGMFNGNLGATTYKWYAVNGVTV